MEKNFWRPLLIMVGALVLILTYAQMIPPWKNKVFATKRFDLAKDLKDAFLPSPADTIQAIVKKFDVSGETRPMLGFIEKLDSLKQSRSGNLRVAYFGDSIIEGDLISGKLREQLQIYYGGSGVGLVPITSIVNEFRRTIRHRFSKNWETLSFMNRGSGSPLGIIGYTFIPRGYYYAETVVQTQAPASPAGDSLQSNQPASPQTRKERQRFYTGGPAWVEYSGVDYPGGSTEFNRIRLFYSHARQTSQVSVSLDGGPYKTYYLQPSETVQALDLSPAAPIKKIRLEFNAGDPIHVYGVSFDDRTGVYVDNLSVRGFSGMSLDAIPAQSLSAFQAALHYDLIILQYGENASDPNTRDYGYYKRGMTRSVKHLQAALPGVPILVISAHDRSIRRNGTFQTSPDIPILVNTQSQLAAETGCAFWNLFMAMGGMNSMPGYVNAAPPLANLDYTHFTVTGANKVAMMLYKVLTTGKVE